MPPRVLETDEAEFPPTDAVPMESLFVVSQLPERPQPAAGAPAPSGAEGASATFLSARVRHFNAACQMLAVPQLTQFVNELRRTLSSPALKLGGHIAQRRPDSILLAFTHDAADRMPTHARRALHAAVLTVHEVVRLVEELAPRMRAAGLPPPSVAVGVHLGPAEVTPRAGKSERRVHAAGEAVDTVRLLEGVAAELGWGIAASVDTRLAGGTRVSGGRLGSLLLADGSALELTEIEGLVARPGSATPPSHYEMLRASLRRNQDALRAGADEAPQEGQPVRIGEGAAAAFFIAPAGG
jgi:class 3 adenylate cyclase